MRKNTRSNEVKKIIRKISRTLSSPRDKDFLRRVWMINPTIYKNRIKAINFVGKNNVLDAGSGFGQWSVALASLNKNVVGVEISEERLRVSKNIADSYKIKNVKFLKGNIEKLRFNNNTFDAIFSYSVIYQTDFRKTFRELYRVIKKGGNFYFATNDLGWYVYNLIEQHNPSKDFSPRQMAVETLNNTINYYTMNKHEQGKSIIMPQELILNELKKIGFKIIDYGRDGSINFHNRLRIKSFYKREKYNLRNVYEVLCQKK